MSYRILIIDDDCEEHFFMTEAFRKDSEKHVVISMDGGERAFLHLSSCDKDSLPDMILLDINMPRMDGFEVLEQLRAHPYTKNIPVYMLSTSDEPEDISKAKKLGSSGYFCKPSTFYGYRTTVTSILSFHSNAHKPGENTNTIVQFPDKDHREHLPLKKRP